MCGPLIFFYLVERYTRCDISVIQVCICNRFIKQVFKERQWFNKGEWFCAFVNLKINLILY
ncbi:hypothetical protein EFW57_01109 [Bacillus velezensis]|nr:hypothetical protein EFW57_01109 [Bacillus velezensis]